MVNFFGDRTAEFGLFDRCKYDDDGVKTTKFPIVEKGNFHALPDHSRSGAHGGREGIARLLLRGQLGARSVPAHAQRVAGAVGRPDHLDDLVSGVEDGILIDGTGSYSIDQQRYNFQFGGRRVLGDQGRQEARDDFARGVPSSHARFLAGLRRHRRARLLADSSGLPNDGKGEPQQINAMSHGCAPTRIRQINVIVTD
jgi:TldD protein